MSPLLNDTTVVVEQGARLLRALPDGAYTRREPYCFNSTLGGHIRHNYDHLVNLLNGWPEGFVDYDARQRNARIENEPGAAAEALEAVARRLQSIPATALETPLRVKMDSGSEADEADWSQSTLRRELQFVLSHSVHHYALIATICALHGITVPEGFGVAPSTLRHHRAEACPPRG
jgi:uncharacterized damage-inducible protein DinB